MRLLKVAAASLNQTPLDWRTNLENIVSAIKEARSLNCSILCLPELCITGYGAEDAFSQRHVQLRALDMLETILPYTTSLLVAVGLPLRFNNSLFNVAALIADGKLCGFVAKRHLAGSGIHYEPRWFKAWPEGKSSSVELWGKEFPIGDIYFDISGVKLGFEICEDAWVAKRPGAELAQAGVDIILNPSASHFAFGKFEVRKRFVLEGSRAFGTSYIYANLLGNEAGRVIYDGGNIIASAGELLSAGKRFSFKSQLLTTAVIDIEKTRSLQAQASGEEINLQAPQHLRIKVPYSLNEFKQIPSVQGSRPGCAFEQSSFLKEEEFTRAEALGLFDYLRKSKARGFVVSLSGGADSAAVSCLVAQMVELAVAELGLETFCQKLKLENPQPKNSREALRRLLLCVYQSSENSSEATKDAAKTLAEGLGAEFMQLDISRLVQAYVQLIEGAISRELNWENDDIALQNIQARVRAPSVWLLANLRQSLLLVTSNRSEAAVGYATMDGDTAGSLSPLGGIDKAFLRSYLKLREYQALSELEPIKALNKVNQLQPTAELRPASSQQTDERDLMPYAFLDKVERAALLDRRSPLEIYQTLAVELPQYSRQEIGLWIKRFFTLWCRNQWKRERYAPGFHLDDESLDPKTWCRFPILSGNYEIELEELARYLQTEESGHGQ